MNSRKLAVGYETLALQDRAFKLAQQLNLPLDAEALPRLEVKGDRLALLMPGFAPLYADFSQEAWQDRRAAGKNQGIVRACKPLPGIKIIDATAGWGRDAAILASFGAEVCMIERNPVMAAMLQDALGRLDESSPLKKSLSLIHGDAKEYLNSLATEQYPDVIYIDPMHPVRQKSALVKKNMQALQSLLGADVDALELLQAALQRMKQRVVVKWPQRSKPLLKADASISGKTVRFDIYLKKINRPAC
ncbi:class I SAM-dependent methyltransferase [Legionella londiniensis]|uniref:Ribosomal RNA small subunit methyltransferase J n=1 Tax=Legionella londiniensis TaxID=45068 RepID=A0A0W0VSC4_9GAMM|nr:class I SAM-dependent methyltransferase [Legionella londiniensis]KTD22954.1 SAM-dependent methyltransferase [Legionella londiniensis]STX92938.1 N6-adenine-specific methylase [Legionella londiniensis]